MIAAAGPQPDLRPFIVYDRISSGQIPFVVTDDRTEPLLRPGDVVLVDTTDTEPTDRDLFVIRWSTGACALVETFLRPGRYGCGPNGEYIESFAWFVGAYNRPRGSNQVHRWARAGHFRGVDGPYTTEGEQAGHLQSKLVGRVIGVLQPSFDEPKRIGREARQ